MNKSLKRDIQLLTKILDNQNKIIKVLKRFGCNQKNLENDIEARFTEWVSGLCPDKWSL